MVKKAKELERVWKKDGVVIEQALKEVTGLRFSKNTKLDCFINTKVSFSCPLSVKVDTVSEMKDTLIHELIHILLDHNEDKIKKSWFKFHELFKEEVFTTRVHVFIHAAHLLVAKKITPNRIKHIRFSREPDYVRSWKIVDNFGAEKVIKLALSGY